MLVHLNIVEINMIFQAIQIVIKIEKVMNINQIIPKRMIFIKAIIINIIKIEIFI